ncbi:putative protein diaphanous-like protein [Cricetulus griseus]|uniref:Diaphanous related formin 3 n=1 Tax=Cricetulus griseus TaxID=10029 RepID=A0A061IM67_CRIGR|nr:putative protein diaphanous-like protein [Cricetulus griseus]
MERQRARALGRDSKAPRRKGLSPAPPSGPHEPGEKRPKLHLNIRTLTDDMLDKFASIRIPGSKKERPPLPNLKHLSGSSDHSSAFSETRENIPKPLSENEVLKLFENMMEDMNLNEDKKAPLREKDFSIKKEMVMQYINTASKTGSLRSSRQISPQEFIHELKMGYTDDRLFTYLESLRVSLTSNPVSSQNQFSYGLLSLDSQFTILLKGSLSPGGFDGDPPSRTECSMVPYSLHIIQLWVQSFGHEGLGLLLDILEKLINGQIQERVVKKSQHKVIQCLKALMNTQIVVCSLPTLVFPMTLPDEYTYSSFCENYAYYGLERIMSEERSLSLLAKAMDPKQPSMMADVVKLLSAMCIVGEESIQQYFKLIDECVSQIVLHRDGMDPDFTYRKRLDLDLSQFVDVCIDQGKLEEYEEKASELCQKFEKEFTDHQETQAQLQKKEAKINELQAELQAFKSQIGPNEMSENCFWVKVNENKYENTDLLCKLENTFCCQQKVKMNTNDFEEKKVIKKRIKELKFLDPKIAQNLSIFLSSFRVPYEEIKMMILEVDETQLSESLIQNLLKHLPDEEQLNSLSQFKSDYNNLCEPEQFAVKMSNVKRLRPRLSAILFKLQFEEQVNTIKPDIMAVSTACEEIKKSKSFSKLLELVLLMGNYMNAGSRNAQTFGFDLSSLCKLKDIKSADQKTTLLHFLVDICEEKYPDILPFVDDFAHLDKACRVSVEVLEKNLKQMGRQLQQLEKNLETFPPPEDLHDKFVIKIFVSSANEQYANLSELLDNMTQLYQSVMAYYAVDMKKVSVEDFFNDLNNFRTTFMQALKENIKKREAAENDKRARIAKERAEQERLQRQLEKKRLLEMKTEADETGVMDSLLEALQSGAAFRDRRKRTPKPKGEFCSCFFLGDSHREEQFLP